MNVFIFSNVKNLSNKRAEYQRKIKFFFVFPSGSTFGEAKVAEVPIPELRSPIPADAPTRSLSRSLST